MDARPRVVVKIVVKPSGAGASAIIPAAMDVSGRLQNAGIILVGTLIFIVPLWFLSVGLYSWGLWPLGAIIRVGDWIIALFGLYWVIHHLRGSPAERLLKRVQDNERMR